MPPFCSLHVTAADVAEFNPRFDTDGNAARVAAGLVWTLARYWEKSPPTTDTPRARLDSAPAPKPSAIGSVPINAAIVVIMIGRNRTRHP